MKGFIFLVVSVGSLALAPPSAGAVIIPPPDGSLTIAASPTRITVGDSTTISGKLSGSLYSESAVSLEANPAPFASGFQSVATTKTDANGNYSFANVRPALNTRYRTVTECVTICPLEAVVIPCPVLQSSSPLPCPGGTVSPELLVEVRIKLTLRVSDSTAGRAEQVRFFGRALPAHDGLAVRIQRRRRASRWVDVAQTALKDAGPDFSRFSRGFAPRAGRYRARVYHDADHAGGTSRLRRITSN